MGRQEVAAAGSGGVGRRGTGVGEFDDQIRKLRVKLENESLEILAFVNLAERFSLTSRLNPTPPFRARRPLSGPWTSKQIAPPVP